MAWDQVPTFFCTKRVNILLPLITIRRQEGRTDKIGILWPDAVRSDELLHVDVHETGFLEPLF